MAKGALDRLRLNGFDSSYNIPFTKEYKVACSQCEALAIIGRTFNAEG